MRIQPGESVMQWMLRVGVTDEQGNPLTTEAQISATMRKTGAAGRMADGWFTTGLRVNASFDEFDEAIRIMLYTAQMERNGA